MKYKSLNAFESVILILLATISMLLSISAADFISIAAHAIDILPLAQELLLNGETETALEAEAIYLRGKDGWKTSAQQLADKANKI